ncbi:MAG: AAA family ATPase [Parasphingorhabdus sp.]|uniref:AAA family ATPase n=1 Tax=Parasphingorhabdus sp. TaxID=2709688 RepID=UPI003002829E
MLIRKIAIENVRSFLDRREMVFEGGISIIIGPNGGGKTNLLDTMYTMLKKHLLATKYLHSINDGTPDQGWQLSYNDQFNNINFDKHSSGSARDQHVELEVEVSQSDIDNMAAIKADYPAIQKLSKRRFYGDPWAHVQGWDVNAIAPKSRLTYKWSNGALEPTTSNTELHFLQYLQLYEFDNMMRAEVGKAALKMSMLYLPVNRASAGFPSKVALANYNDIEQKKSLDATSSRSGGSIISLAIGRIAQKYRLLQEDDNTSAKEKFYADKSLQALSSDLDDLGYKWELTTINALSNEYDVTLTKQGSSFLVGAASSGERELLTYLFAIYALNVRDTLIIVDEPELHLHPRWQTSLFNLFVKLSKSTGNQFVLATHSPTFISPESIKFVSRIYIQDQKSDIVRLNASNLPNAKHLFNIVNSQNNESIFFTDRVLLVEGISDKIFFDRVFDILSREAGQQRDSNLEIVSVGGKGFFPAYQMLLKACKVQGLIIADLDYIEQIGNSKVKALFKVDSNEIKKDVLDNAKSLDGDFLVKQIDHAIATGDWGPASDTWSYIKSRRIVLKDQLNGQEMDQLNLYINELTKSDIFLLSRGALEAYLPAGYASKNLEKLIEFVPSENFWNDLPIEGRNEIAKIGRTILGLAHPN